MFRRPFAIVLTVCLLAIPSATQSQSHTTAGKTYDEILDTYVRDGLVYYRELKIERTRFDAYIGTLASASSEVAPRDEPLSFWLNAYTAIVPQTVIDHEP